MNKHYYAVIMAGGGGTRLWPLSRKSQPKQMLPIGSSRTLFQQAIDRLVNVMPLENILIVTVAEQASKLQEQAPHLPVENFLLEPMPRGTASVVGLAAVAIRNRDADPQACMAVLTADHFIRNVARFQELLEASRDLALRDYLVTLGIEATKPSSAYGYIEQGSQIDASQGVAAFTVKKFTEKPAVEQAQIMLAKGGFSWNSGMFIWRVEKILSEISKFLPDLSARLEIINQAWQSSNRMSVLKEQWPGIQKETIDYGIMEKSTEAAVIRAENLGWYDVGSWDSLSEVLIADPQGNYVMGADHISINSTDNLVVAEKKNRPIVTMGLHNLVIVETDHALLVCPREDAQKVRAIIDLLQMTGREDLL